MQFSYARVIRLPNVLALLTATGLARLAGRTFSVAIVFHVLASFNSPVLAGWIAFAAMVPGLVVSPLAGAFLDRAGAPRGIAIDLGVSMIVMLAIAAAIMLEEATPPVLFALTSVLSLTTPLSVAGFRVLLPRLVPAAALDKANALDTVIHALVGVIGPTLGGTLIGLAAAFPAFVVIAICYAAATFCMTQVRGIAPPGPVSGDFLRQAWDGVMFLVRRPLLRGLAVGYGLNLATWGILVVALPVVVAQSFRPGTWQLVSGLLWAGVGLCAGAGAILAGLLHVFGREVRVMTIAMVATAVAAWPIAACLGIPGLAAGLALAGLLAGPIDVGVLTLRQRRTDPAELGRVMAVSISANISGFPIGTALGGILVAWSPPSAFVAAAVASLLGAVAMRVLIPVEDR